MFHLSLTYDVSSLGPAGTRCKVDLGRGTALSWLKPCVCESVWVCDSMCVCVCVCV